MSASLRCVIIWAQIRELTRHTKSKRRTTLTIHRVETYLSPCFQSLLLLLLDTTLLTCCQATVHRLKSHIFLLKISKVESNCIFLVHFIFLGTGVFLVFSRWNPVDVSRLREKLVTFWPFWLQQWWKVAFLLTDSRIKASDRPFRCLNPKYSL